MLNEGVSLTSKSKVTDVIACLTSNDIPEEFDSNIEVLQTITKKLFKVGYLYSSWPFEGSGDRHSQEMV